MAVASQLPVLHVEKAFFKVVGERFVTPSSLVQFVLKCRFIPPGSVNVPEVDPSDLEDIDPEEGDVAAITGRKDDRSGEKPIQPPLAHAPYFARDHAPQWHVFLADSKQGKIAVPPFTFQTFDKPILTEDGKHTYNVQTMKMQFGAPPQPGSYTFVMHMICDSYIGMDTQMQVTLVVEDASKVEEIGEEDEISEPDEGEFRLCPTNSHPYGRQCID
jgi:translocation protein SEC63